MSDKVNNTSDVRTLVKNNTRTYSKYLILPLIAVMFAVLTGGLSLSPRNFSIIFFLYSYVLILAVGMALVILIQRIDLSVGSVCAFVGALSVMIYNTGIGMPATLICSLAVGVGIGAFHGVWIAFLRVPAFIVTLAGMFLFRALAYIVLTSASLRPMDMGYSYIGTGILDEILSVKRVGQYNPLAFLVAVVVLLFFFIAEILGRKKRIANDFKVISLPLFIGKLALFSLLVLGLAERFARYRGLPIVVLVILVTVVIFNYILKYTVLGRYIYAVGGNPNSARLSGINSDAVTFAVYCIMGGLTGLAAVVYTGSMNLAVPQAGNLFELDTIAACYIGGISASGGIGTIAGAIIGGLVMSIINNGMSLMNIDASYQSAVKALILLFAIVYDIYSRRRAGLG